MKTSQILSAVVVALLAASGAAHAEEYDGVHALTNQRTRAEVRTEAVVAAHSADPYAEGASSAPVVIVSSANRGDVRAAAVTKSHDLNGTLDARAFYNSVVPAQFKKATVNSPRQAAL